MREVHEITGEERAELVALAFLEGFSVKTIAAAFRTTIHEITRIWQSHPNYLDTRALNKKILQDILEEGDAPFHPASLPLEEMREAMKERYRDGWLISDLIGVFHVTELEARAIAAEVDG